MFTNRRKIDTIFLLLIIALMLVTPAYGAEETLSVSPKKGMRPVVSANKAKDGSNKCFFDSVGGVINRLKKLTKDLENFCSLEKNKLLTPFIKVAKLLANIEALKNGPISPAKNKAINAFVKKYKGKYFFVRQVPSLRDLKVKKRGLAAKRRANDIWRMVQDYIDNLFKKKGFPTYFRHIFSVYVKEVRYLAYVQRKFGAKPKACFNIKYLDEKVLRITDLTRDKDDLEFNPNYKKCKGQEDWTIKPLALEKGGWIGTFWVKEDLRQIMKKRKINVLQGFKDNKEFFKIDLYKVGTRVAHKIRFGSFKKKFKSHSHCSDMAFVIIAFGWHCNMYKFSIVFRFLVSNKRVAFVKNLPAAEVENVKIRFNHAEDPKMYEGYGLTLSREKRLFAEASPKPRLQKLNRLLSGCEKPRVKCNYQIPGKCIICAKGTRRYKGKCIKKCPLGTYPTKKGNTCAPCQKRCRWCYGPKNGQCTNCKKKFVLHKNKCLKRCPIGWVALKSKKGILRCLRCGKSCLKCKNPKTCKKCDPKRFLHKKQCVSKCPRGFFKRRIPNKCFACPKPCSQCRGPKSCFSCKNRYFLYKGKCIKKCPHKYFANKANFKCTRCTSHCKKCDNQTTCKKCIRAYFLTRTGQCVTKCPDGTVEIKGTCVNCGNNCKECSPRNVKICKKCRIPYVLKKGTCHRRCGNFWWVDAKRRCQKCRFSYCRICTKDRCRVCAGRRVLLNGRHCKRECPKGYAQRGRVCVQCKDSKFCEKCDPATLCICKRCVLGRYLHFGKCLDKCPRKYFRKNRKCHKCMTGCLGCKKRRTCIMCERRWFKKGSICVRRCGLGWVANRKKICKKCKIRRCATCPARNLRRCINCKRGFVLYNNKCYRRCPGRTFRRGNKCFSCTPDCLICRSKSVCRRCKPPKVLQGIACKNICNDKYTAVNGICKKCLNKTCRRCSRNLRRCTHCPRGLVLQSGNCVLKCFKGWYVRRGRCYKCLKPCATCRITSRACITCIKGFNLLIRAGKRLCVDNCPIRTMKNIKKKTCDYCTVKRCLKCSPVNRCIRCEKKKVLFKGNCSSRCPRGYFPKKGICRRCLRRCAVCRNRRKCVKCEKRYFLFKNDRRCVPRCDSGYVAYRGRCIKCKGNCKRCNPIKTSHCTKCPRTLMLYQGNCVSRCPYGTWADYHTRTCRPCLTANCKRCYIRSRGRVCRLCKGKLLLQNNKCVPSPCKVNYCLNPVRRCIKSKLSHVLRCTGPGPRIIDCVGGYYLVNGKSCKSECPLGQFKNVVKKRCDKCSSHCLVCKNKKICTRCKLTYNLYKNKCRRHCPPGWASVRRVCVKCKTKFCKRCYNPKKCDRCIKKRYLFKNTCVKKCPKATYKYKFWCRKCGFKCNKCINNRKCVACVKPFHLSHNGKCVGKCVAGYVSIRRRCKKCLSDKNCTKCSPGNRSECLECRGKLVFNTITKKCIKPPCPKNFYLSRDRCFPCFKGCEKCKDGFTCRLCRRGWTMYRRKCRKRCPSRYEIIKRRCVKCPTKCLTCRFGKCNFCIRPWKLIHGKCRRNCPDNYYNKNYKCRKCEKFCRKCIDSTTCRICRRPRFLKNGNCVKKCGVGFYENTNKGICKNCRDLKCVSCKKSSKICDNCKGRHVLHKNHCHRRCPNGWYKTKKRRCRKCLSKCLKCKNSKFCKVCRHGFYLAPNKKKCNRTCPVGYRRIKKNGVGYCEKCKDRKCARCSINARKCQICVDKWYIFRSRCYPKCPTGTYLAKNKKVCKRCRKTCVDCQDYNTCKKCKGGFSLQGVKCLTKCKHGFADVKGVCKPCKCKNCKKCNVGLNECYKCMPGYNLLKYVTDITPKNYKGKKRIYKIKTKCLKKCPRGYSPLRGRCIKCISNCFLCTNRNSCKRCKKGYLLQRGKCVRRCSAGWIPIGLFCRKCKQNSCKVCSKNKLSRCRLCFRRYFLKLGRCVSKCGKGWYAIYYNRAKTKGHCKPCGRNCNICVNGNRCVQCKKGLYRLRGKCRTRCPSGWVSDSRKICHKCTDRGCVRCPIRNLSYCNKCRAGLYLKNGDCVRSCGKGFYTNSRSQCEKCKDRNCNKCAPADTCLRCKDNWYIFNDKCHKSCPRGYMPRNGKKCEKCKAKGCNKCALTLAPCFSCSFPAVLHRGRCIRKCPKEWYRTRKNKCRKCSSNCALCRSGRKCDKCSRGFFVSLDGKCRDKCPNGSGPNPVTKKCHKCKVSHCNKCKIGVRPNGEPTGLIICSGCRRGMVRYRGKCRRRCPKGTYKFRNICRACFKGCIKCKNNRSCIECKRPLVLQSNSCIKKCLKGCTTISGICRKCKICHCKKCDGNIRSCRQCFRGSYLWRGKCHSKCPLRTYPKKDGKCYRCSKKCLKCTDSTSCNKCKRRFVLFGKRCFTKCPTGYIAIRGVCKKCKNTLCNTCRFGDTSKCITCPKRFFFYRHNCVPSCPRKYFESYVPRKICRRCGSNCVRCKNSKFCRKCSRGFVLNNKKCIRKCPPGKVNKNGTCYWCYSRRCLTCLPTNFNNCRKCKKKFFLYKKLCTHKCPNRFFGNRKTRKCEKCKLHCHRCINKRKCRRCVPGFYFWRKTNSCRKCRGRLDVRVGLRCQKCKPWGCFRCYNGKPNKCFRCQRRYVMFGGKCQKTCPKGYYRKGQSCFRCNLLCAKCRNKRSCDECIPKYNLFKGYKCLKKCPKGYADVGKDCKPCRQSRCEVCPPRNLRICNKCKPPFMLYKRVCLSSCPRGTFMEGGKCKNCPDNCSKCNAKFCLACNPPRKLKGQQCVKHCGKGYYDNFAECIKCNTTNCASCKPNSKCRKCNKGMFLLRNRCHLICPKGFYANKKNGKCTKCNKMCKECTSRGCIICKKGYNLIVRTKKCTKRCPNGWTPVNQVCVRCTDRNCFKCYPEKPQRCMKCRRIRLLFRGMCIKKCPDGWYPKRGKCQRCKRICKTCSNSKTCNSCRGNFILHKKQCIDQCPDSMVLYKGKCLSCTDHNCKKCTPALNKCLQCLPPFHLHKGKCLSICPKGWYSKKGYCNKCSTGCINCKNKGKCSQCRKGFYLHKGKCDTYCPKKYWPNCARNRCDKCDKSCQTCIDGTNQCGCAKGFFRFGDGRCCQPTKCPNGTYPSKKSKRCEKCNIEFCKICVSKFKCTKCVSGFTVVKGKCKETKVPTEIVQGPTIYSWRTFKLFRTREVYSFNKDIKGGFVGSNVISFSFWFRYLKSTLNRDFKVVVFETRTTKSPPIQAMQFVVKSFADPKIATKCYIRSKTPKGRTYILGSTKCGFKFAKNWTFYAITIKKNSGEFGSIKVYSKRLTGTLKTFVTPIKIQGDLITKDTVIAFNGKSRADAYQMWDYMLYDYSITKKQLDFFSKARPPRCDYGCTKCKGVCIKCAGRKPNANGSCPPVFVPLKPGIADFDTGIRFRLAPRLHKSFVSDNWAFTSWFYINSSANYVDLFSIQLTANISDWRRSKFVQITVKNGVININGAAYKALKVKSGYWYAFMYRIDGKKQTVTMRSLKGKNIIVTKGLKQIQRIYDDLTIWIGVKFINQRTKKYKGVIYQSRIYLNGVGALNRAPGHIHKPLRCARLGRNMKCIACVKKFFFNKTTGKCERLNIVKSTRPISLLGKKSIWNFDLKRIKIKRTVMKRQFSITFWVRKKMFSSWKFKNTRYSFLSLFDSKSNTITPLITANTQPKYQTVYTAFRVNDYTKTYFQGNFKWDFYTLNFDLKKKSLNIIIITGNKKSYSFSKTFKRLRFDQIQFGDFKGNQMNFEVGLVKFWFKNLTARKIARLKRRRPRDCSASCLNCNYKKGVCRQCKIRRRNVRRCPNFLNGFVYSYMYGRSRYGEIPPSTNWLLNNRNTFKKDVNSRKYAIIGYYKVLDLQSMFNTPSSYNIFQFGQNNLKNFIAGKNLIALNIEVKHGKATFVFVVNQTSTDLKIPIKDLKIVENRWYFIHAGIDVKKKIFKLLILDPKRKRKKYFRTIKLKVAPVRAQETSELKLFGVGQHHKHNDPVSNGQFHRFYLSLDMGFNYRKVRLFLRYFKTPRPPRCPKNCATCIGVSRIAKRNTCIICHSKYHRNESDHCVRNPHIPAYNFLVLNARNLHRNTSFIINHPAFSDNNNVNVAFFIRKSYQPRKAGRIRKLVSYGNLRVGLESTDNSDHLIFKVQGAIKHLKMPVRLLGGHWSKVSFNVSKNRLTVLVQPKGGAAKKGVFNFKIINWNNSKFIHFHLQHYMINFYGIHLFNGSNLLKTLIKFPYYQECPYDCNFCYKGYKCKGCYYGKLVGKNKCTATSLWLWNTKITRKSGAEHIPISNFLNKSKVYRSNKFAYVAQFSKNINKSRLRETIVRINNLKNTQSDKKGIQHNAFVLEYEAPDKFYFLYNNRDVAAYYGAPIEIPLKMKVSPINNQFYFLINYDGKKHTVEIFIQNTQGYLLAKKIKLQGRSEYLSNNAYIHLGDPKGTTTYFRYQRFYYESNKSRSWFHRHIKVYVALTQKTCIRGNMFNCKKCVEGHLTKGTCLPTKRSREYFVSKEGNTKLLHLSNAKRGKRIRFQRTRGQLRSFTVSFYYRRTEYDINGHGIALIGNVLQVYVRHNNLYIVGLVGNRNSIVLNNLYHNKKEKYNWIYVTVKYDIVRNRLSVYTIIKNKRNIRTDSQSHTETKKNKSISASRVRGAVFGFPLKKGRKFSPFDLSAITYTPNYLISNDGIFKFRHIQPLPCITPCDKNCSQDLICKPKHRVHKQLTISNIFIRNPGKAKRANDPAVLNSIKAFRNLRDIGTNLSRSLSFGYYLASIYINVSHLYKSAYKVNSNLLLVISNDEKSQNLKLGDTIPDSIVNYGILSIVNNNGILRVYAGSNVFAQEINYIDLNFHNKSLKAFQRIYLSFLFDSHRNKVKFIIFIDEIETSHILLTKFLPGHLTTNTLFYTHPGIKHAHVQIFNPRFFNDFEKNLFSKKKWLQLSVNNLCNKRGGENTCAKCIYQKGMMHLSCKTCNKGYAWIRGSCIKKYQKNKKWLNFNKAQKKR